MKIHTVNHDSPIRGLLRHSLGRKLFSRVAGPLVRIELPNHPYAMVLDTRDAWGVSKHILKHGDYDVEICKTLLRILPKGARCLDIGANIGFWSCFLASELDATSVVAVEPEPSNLRLLKKNVSLNDLNNKIRIIEAAADTCPGALDLYLSPDNAGDHQLYAADTSRTKVQVPVVRLDDVIDSAIDFVKIDVQGYEWKALGGLEKTLTKNKGVKILMEYWPTGIQQSGGDPKHFRAWLTSLGFHFFAPEMNLKEVELDSLDDLLGNGHHVDLILMRPSI